MLFQFEQTYYESDSDYTSLKAVSTNLDSLFKQNRHGWGSLITIDQSVFDQEIDILLSTGSIDSIPGIKVENFAHVLNEYHKKSKTSLK